MSIDTIVTYIGWTVLVSGGVLVASLAALACAVRGTRNIVSAARRLHEEWTRVRWSVGLPRRSDRDAVILARMVMRAMDQIAKNGNRFGFSPNEADTLDRWRYAKLHEEETP